MLVMKVNDFIKRLRQAEQSKTLYVMGCFGAPMNQNNKNRYKKNHYYNCNPERQRMIDNCSNDSFGFDCVNLIKGILWGWNGNIDKVYGGAVFKSNGVPDYAANEFFNLCCGISSNFKGIKPGCIVWMQGHVGVYVGNGEVIECTPSFKNCVQVTKIINCGGSKTGNWRIWSKWGFCPFIDYSEDVEVNSDMKIYNDIKEIPISYKKSIQWYIDAGYLKGTGKGLELTEEMCRILTIMERILNK